MDAIFCPPYVSTYEDLVHEVTNLLYACDPAKLARELLAFAAQPNCTLFKSQSGHWWTRLTRVIDRCYLREITLYDRRIHFRFYVPGQPYDIDPRSFGINDAGKLYVAYDARMASNGRTHQIR